MDAFLTLKRKAPIGQEEPRLPAAAALPVSIKLAIVGYRHFHDYAFLCEKVDRFVEHFGTPRQIISGGCVGTDKLAERYAREHNIHMRVLAPDASIRNNSKFALRDKEIARLCTHMIAFPSAQGKGTQLTVDFARSFHKQVQVHWTEAATPPPPQSQTKKETR
jgi:hypothetical protein